MSQLAPTPTTPSVSAASPFDAALFAVSDCLAEARYCEEQGRKRRARILYTRAERFALRSGFVELMCLVWQFQDAAAVA